MATYIALLRGINVGGKNKVAMPKLKQCFEKLGFQNVRTYINSGNVIFASNVPASTIAKQIETALPKQFKLDSDLIKAFVLSKKQFQDVFDNAPAGFGKEPGKYYYDVVFLNGITSQRAANEFDPNPEVDTVWVGHRAIYYRRLSAQLAKSRLAKITSKAVYKNMTIRSWNTVGKILALVSA